MHAQLMAGQSCDQTCRAQDLLKNRVRDKLDITGHHRNAGNPSTIGKNYYKVRNDPIRDDRGGSKRNAEPQASDLERNKELDRLGKVT